VRRQVQRTLDSQFLEIVRRDDGVLGFQRSSSMHLAEDFFAESLLAARSQAIWSGFAANRSSTKSIWRAYIWNILTSAPDFSRPACQAEIVALQSGEHALELAAFSTHLDGLGELTDVTIAVWYQIERVGRFGPRLKAGSDDRNSRRVVDDTDFGRHGWVVKGLCVFATGTCSLRVFDGRCLLFDLLYPGSLRQICFRPAYSAISHSQKRMGMSSNHSHARFIIGLDKVRVELRLVSIDG
jgi:hypothetical protein